MSNAAPNPRHLRQDMLALLAHESHGAKGKIYIEKTTHIKVEAANLACRLRLAYTPQQHTFEASTLEAYFAHMLALTWPSASEFTHTLAADLYDHGLPLKLTLEVAVDHEGFTETVEAKHRQPEY